MEGFSTFHSTVGKELREKGDVPERIARYRKMMDFVKKEIENADKTDNEG
jgi:hypothetical protein